MNGAGTESVPPGDRKPRLLRLTLNGKSCYALKWQDELTENRRELNYVLREAATNDIRCLLVDCPLRIAGFPELVSVQTTGRTLERAGAVWELAVTIWADGDADDEGLIRICAPETFRGRAQYLRDDLTRMIREYRAGTRECHTPTVSSPAIARPSPPDAERVGQRLDALTAALQQAAVHKADTPATVSPTLLRREIAPVLEAVKAFGEKMTQELDEVAPHIAADRCKAQLAWIKKTHNCSEVESKAALLATEGMSLADIAKRLPHKDGKAMTREGVRQVLLRFERKAGQIGLFSRGTYRENERAKGEENQGDDEGET